MNCLRLLVFLLLFPASAIAKDSYYSFFNTDAFWQSLVVDSPGADIRRSANDTVIIVASNRAAQPGNLRFMSELRGDGSVQYFLVYAKEGRWHVQQRPSLRNAMEGVPQKDKDWVIYTEGMGRIFTTNLDRGISLAGQYAVNVLMLDYPSIHSDWGSYRNYRFAYRNACIAYKDFVEVLDTLKKLRLEGNAGNGLLTMFFHSMGNNVLRKIAQSRLLHKYNDTVWVRNIILNAPCVPNRRHARWLDRIHFAGGTFITYNPQDLTLKWARIAGLRRILGERPKRPLSKRANYINFNRLCGTGHSNFLSLYGRGVVTKEAFSFYNTLFHFQVPVTLDLTYQKRYQKTEDGIGYYILPY